MKQDIEVDFTKAIKKMDIFEKKQLPFATALALTWTANEARDDFIDKQLTSEFTLRKGWWKPGTRYGFNVTKATKKNLTAVVFTRAWWMRLQETGGTKKPQGSHIAIPSRTLTRAKSGLIPKARWPRQVMASGKGFIIQSAGQKVMMRRTAKKKVEAVYILEKQATINQRLNFNAKMKRSVRRIFPAQFNQAMRKAQDTAK